MSIRKILLSCLLLTAGLYAQNIDSIDIQPVDSLKITKIKSVKKHSTSTYGGYGGFMLGGVQVDLKNLNSSLKNHGYREFDEIGLSTGGGGWGVINNLLIGGEGHSLYGMSRSGVVAASGQRYKMDLKMDYGSFDLGYIFYNRKNFNSYIMGGIGHSSLELRITEDRPELFSELLDNPKRDLILEKETFMIDLSVGGNYLYHFGPVFFLGLKTGYVFAFDQDRNENNILDCPSFGSTGAYAKIFIGFGGGNF